MTLSAGKIVALVIGVLLLGGMAFGARYMAFFDKKLPNGEVRQVEQETVSENSAKSGKDEKAPENVSIEVETVATGLEVPWTIAFTSETRMLVTERPGRLRVIENGKLLPKSLHTFSVSSEDEEGLMGLVVDPDYEKNHFIYVSYAVPDNGALKVKVERFTDNGESLSDSKVILDNIPAARFHAGSALKFGPDGSLYITTGDATDKNIAQDKQNLGGKILRLNADGSIPNDNPFPDSPVWSYGHRNPQGIAWHPVTKELYETEHGPSVFDGPAGGDEVNHIMKGENYGWPLVSHEKKRPGTIVPLLVFTPAEAPASATFYSSDKIPQFTNHFFFGVLKGEGVIKVLFDENNPDKVLSYEKLSKVKLGRIRDVIEGPDGALYFTTSNRDGRGKAASSDDRVMRIRAQ